MDAKSRHEDVEIRRADFHGLCVSCSSGIGRSKRPQSKNIIDDEFIREVINDFQALIMLNGVPLDLHDRMQVVEHAAVRTYQSFDEPPETNWFLELCSLISSNI